MLIRLLGGLMKSKGLKMGAGAHSGGGLIVLILGLNNDISNKLIAQKAEQKEYVQLVLKPLQTQIAYLKEETRETKQLVRDIHNYLLKKK